MRNGKVISRCYEDRVMGVRESEVSYNNLIPAAKADIEMLNRKLDDIATKGNNDNK